MTIREPTLWYRIAFLLGGAAFGVVSYVLGLMVYQVESYLYWGELSQPLDFGGFLSRLLQEHPITISVWVVGATLVFYGLGLLFDRQVKYRQKSEELQSRAEALAVTDGLTLLYNYRYFVEQLGLTIRRTERLSPAFSLLLLDIDNFKQYNDIHGHLAGDDVLRRVAMTISAVARDTDVVARYGGEEFVIISVGTDKAQAAAMAEELRRRVEVSCPVTVSIGVGAFPYDGRSVDELIRAADVAMYEAKKVGKNRVILAEPRYEEKDVSWVG